MPSIDKWRNTTTRGESKAITVLNRYKQKTISLPRFDEGKRLTGYAGLAGTSRTIAKLVPNCKYYIEPFAGTSKVYQELDRNKYTYSILNDKSKFVYDWLMKEFNSDSMTYIFNSDFVPIIERFGIHKSSVFLIDQPWNRSFYDQDYSCFNRESIKQYDEEILKLLENTQAKFIICTKKDNKRMLDSKYESFVIEGDYPIFGKLPQTLITTNIEGITHG